MKYLIASALLALALDTHAGETNTNYPLAICVISGEELGGEMGEPFVYMYKSHEVRFCCKDCVSDFEEDPEAYLKMIEDARKDAAKDKDVELKNAGHDHPETTAKE